MAAKISPIKQTKLREARVPSWSKVLPGLMYAQVLSVRMWDQKGGGSMYWLKLSYLFLLCGVFATSAANAFAAESACVKCHTSDATLKSLFTPPTPTGGEEGEG
jgi:hypothetical protein